MPAHHNCGNKLNEKLDEQPWHRDDGVQPLMSVETNASFLAALAREARLMPQLPAPKILPTAAQISAEISAKESEARIRKNAKKCAYRLALRLAAKLAKAEANAK